MFLLFLVDDAPHLVPFVVVQQDLLEVESILGLMFVGELLLDLLQSSVEGLVVGQLIHLLLGYVPSPDMPVLFLLLLQFGPWLGSR